MDYDCGAAGLRLPRPRFQAIRAELVHSLKKTSPADTLATISQRLSARVVRHWRRPSQRSQLYLSIVAEALGLETEPDQLGDFKKTADLEDILDRSRDAWESHGLSREQARDLAARYFADGAMAP